MNVHVPAIVAETFAALAHRRLLDRLRLSLRAGRLRRRHRGDAGRSRRRATTPIPASGASACSSYFSGLHGTPGRLFRLNYAIDMRYGVLHDVARKVRDGDADRRRDGPRQRDLAGRRQRRRRCAASPMRRRRRPRSTSPVRRPSACAGSPRSSAGCSGKTPRLVGTEAATGWLNNASRMVAEFGPPRVPLERMIEWTADWVAHDRASLGKPTHYEVRDGRY